MKLSVIIPAYNVAGYIGECLDSVVNQTYRDLEIIVVNDGSTDDTRAVISRYENDDRVVVIDKSNGGLSDARNAGIEQAKGDLITFVDGDDVVSDDCYEQNVRYFTADDAPDMVQFPVLFDWLGERQYLRKPPYGVIRNGDVFPSWWKNELLIYSVCNKIYRREVFHSIRFPYGKCFEDMYLVPDLSQMINKVIVSEAGVYYYRYREGSILNSNVPYSKHRDQLDAMLRMYNESLNYSGLVSERAGFWIDIIWWQFYSLHHYSKQEQANSIHEFQKSTLSFMDFINGHLSLKKRFRILVLRMSGFRFIFSVFQLWKSFA